MGMSSASIKVAVRCRPYTFEDKLGVHLVQQSEDKAAIKLVNYTGTSKRFASTWGWWSAYGWKRHQKGDEALAEEMSLVPQTSVYETAGIPIRTHVLNGSAVVMFSYGAYGSGKNFTIFGPDDPALPEAWFKWPKPHDLWGIFPRVAYDLFEMSDQTWKFSMKYFQNIGDEILDLMSPTKETKNSKIGLQKDYADFNDISWCTTATLKSWSELCDTFEKADARKVTSPTPDSRQSIRGHRILTLEVSKPKDDEPQIRQQGRIYICDLACPENVHNLFYANYKKTKHSDGTAEYKLVGPHKNQKLTRNLQEQSENIIWSLGELGHFFRTMAQWVKKKKSAVGKGGRSKKFLCKYMMDNMFKAHTYFFCAIHPEQRFHKSTIKVLDLAKTIYHVEDTMPWKQILRYTTEDELKEMKEIHDAKAAAAAAIASDPREIEAILTEAGNPRDALAAVEGYLKYLPGDPNLIALRIKAIGRICVELEQEGMVKESQEMIAQYLKESPDNETLLAWQEQSKDRVYAQVKTLLERPENAVETLGKIKLHLTYFGPNPTLLGFRDQAVLQVCSALEQEGKMKEALQAIDGYLKDSPGNATLLTWRDEAVTRTFHERLREVEAHVHDKDELNQKILQARAFAFSQNLGGSLLALLLEKVPNWPKAQVQNEWLQVAFRKRSENCILAIAMSKQFKGENISNFLEEKIHDAALHKRSPKQDLLLLYLCVALSRAEQPLKLQHLDPKTTAAIVAAARSRMQDADLQAKQVAAANKSAEDAKTVKGFKPIGERATKHFLETKILVPLCLLGNGAKPPIDSTVKPPINSADESPSDVPRQLVQQVLLPTLQRGLQLQIDAAKATTDLLKKVYSAKRVAHRNMYIATIKGIANGDFFKFNEVASQIAALCAKKLGDKSNFRQSTESLVGFYRDAYNQEPVYRRFVKMLGEKTGAEEYTPARIKGAHRALEKMGLRSDGRQWMADNVCDGVRGALVYGEMRNMLTALCLIVSASVDPELSKIGDDAGWIAEKAGIEEKIDVLRVKNRFAEPTSGGWADFMVSFRFRSDPNQHVCELQLCHKDLMNVRKKMGAHHEYGEFRSALELIEVTGHAEVIQNIEASDKSIDVTEFKQNIGMVSAETEKQMEETASELVTIRKELASTQEELAETRKELAATQEQLAATEQKMGQELKEVKSKLEQVFSALKLASISIP